MKALLSFMLLVGATLIAPVNETPKTNNTLTPKEIAAGTILLFDGETTFGWTIEGEANVKDGWLDLGGAAPTKAFLSTQLPENYQLSFEMYRVGGGIIANYLKLMRMAASDEPKTFLDMVIQDRPTHLQFTSSFEGKKLSVNTEFSGDGSKGSAATVVNGVAPGRQNVFFDVPAGVHVLVRNVKLQLTQTAPLFNGNDLTGWKKFETDKARAKSEFGVNKEGELTIKNGPGDLQSEKAFGDFVLQIECKTNGSKLNSGVFFRCRPGEYQNGYEAQIHNGWTDKPEKEYTIEEYDPKTNELKDKKKIKSASMDYGTGAIYRRIPAQGGGQG